LVGGPGADRIVARKTSARAFGNDGSDVIVVDGLEDRASGISGGRGNDYLRGGRNDDAFFGGPGQDRIHGGDGDDVAAMTADGDFFAAGPGHDGVRYEIAGAGIVADLAAGTAHFAKGGTAIDRVVSVEDLDGTEFGDLLYGNAADNEIGGLGGDDSIYGRAGRDDLSGGPGNDYLDGGPPVASGFDDDLLSGGPDTDTCINGTVPSSDCEPTAGP
jgi:Ca2+-binding RTX toxin-like protein